VSHSGEVSLFLSVSLCGVVEDSGVERGLWAPPFGMAMGGEVGGTDSSAATLNCARYGSQLACSEGTRGGEGRSTETLWSKTLQI
jgi:hypothetical protein